jgi:2-keto-4-pentenoate hydratase/2-oxohepta-3-ene-1,7-dioic acid hydratase in catechol pathway
MRFVTVDVGGRDEVAVRRGHELLSTGYSDMRELVRDGEVGLRAARDASKVVPSDSRLLAPIVPGKLLFCGVNYLGHLEENPTAVLPTEPFFFSKLPSAVVGPGADIVIPHEGLDVDYEVELALIVGKQAKNVIGEAAWDHVFGYTIVNDVSARAIQFKDMQITIGKNLDGFCPLGPEIVTPDELGDLAPLGLRTFVNGELRQSERAGDMLFPIPGLFEFVTSHLTLEPGDLITTGTPAGVAAFRDPPPWLQAGDVVSVEVDGIGKLANRFVSP